MTEDQPQPVREIGCFDFSKLLGGGFVGSLLWLLTEDKPSVPPALRYGVIAVLMVATAFLSLYCMFRLSRFPLRRGYSSPYPPRLLNQLAAIDFLVLVAICLAAYAIGRVLLGR